MKQPGEGGGHNVFYNRGSGVMAGPSQGLAPLLGKAVEGTPWASGPTDALTAGAIATAQRLVTGAGETMQTLNESIEMGTVLGDAAEWASGIGVAKVVYDGITYGVGLLGCGEGVIN